MNLEAIKIIVLVCQMNTGDIDKILSNRTYSEIKDMEKSCRQELMNCYRNKAPKYGVADALTNCIIDK